AHINMFFFFKPEKALGVGRRTVGLEMFNRERRLVPLFYADKRAFFCLSIVKSRILSFLNRLKNRDFSLILIK
ncbi:hypothetical protein AB1Y87_18850, partial [Citrobacter freundii]